MQFPVQPGLHPQLTDGLRWWLQSHADWYDRKPQFKYSSSEEVILKEAFPINAQIDEMGAVPDMAFGKCFENAFAVSQSNYRYQYCEGWALLDHSLPTHHAWLMDTTTGKIEDPTWRECYGTMRSEHQDQPWTGCVVYWGVQIKQELHYDWWLSNEYCNLLALRNNDCEWPLRHGLKVFTGTPNEIIHLTQLSG